MRTLIALLLLGLLTGAVHAQQIYRSVDADGKVRFTTDKPPGGVQSNPLATTIRIKYATRGDGQDQYQAPPVRVLNLKVGKKLRLADRRELELSGNIFNLPNSSQHWQYDFANASQEFNPGFLRMLSRQAARALQLTFVLRY